MWSFRTAGGPISGLLFKGHPDPEPLTALDFRLNRVALRATTGWSCCEANPLPQLLVVRLRVL